MDVQSAINTPHIRVKVGFLFLIVFNSYKSYFQLIALIHTCLIAAALNSYWLPAAYQFYNIIFIITLFWAIHSRQSSDAVQIVSEIHKVLVSKLLVILFIFLFQACFINVIGFLLDLFGIILYFPSKGAILSAVFAIFNLALRPFTLLLLHRELTDRGGSLSLATETTGNNPSNYEDIDQQHQVFTPTILS